MTTPRRQLGFWVAAAIVVANMVGTGVFTTTGYQGPALHDASVMLFAWILGGVIALAGATCYAELGALMPSAGGEYVYLREAYHPVVGFMSGWASLTAGFSAPIAAAAIAFGKYLGGVVGIASTAQKVIATALVIAATVMHAFDAKLGGRVQTGFTIAKVLLVVVFIVAGLVLGDGDWSHFETTHGGLSQLASGDFALAFATSLMFVSFSYSGWNAAAYIAGEIADPQRTLPRALVVGTAIVMVLYVLLNVVFIYAIAPDAMVQPASDGTTAPIGEIGAAVARTLFGTAAGDVLATLIALALVSAVSAMVMAGPRVYAAMAKDGALPGPLATMTARGVPANAVIAQCVLAVTFVWISNLGQLIELVSFTLSIFAALTVGAVFVFRRRGELSPYRAFLYPVTPVLFIALSAWIVYSKVRSAPLESAIVAGLLAVGAALYLVANRGRTPQGPSAAGV